MVARPCVDYPVRDSKNKVTIGEMPLPRAFGIVPPLTNIACRTLTAAQTLAGKLPRTNALPLDVSSAADLDSAIAAHDLVISLVPYIYHAEIIKLAIKNKVNVVTTSYVSPAIRELDFAAKEAGIVALNEVGVDPGVDHLYAIKTIGEVHSKGGKVSSFSSNSLLPHDQ